MLIPDDFHVDRHIIFVLLTFGEMAGQLSWMEDVDGNLNPRFMKGDFKEAIERRFGVGSSGDHAWECILDMYGKDVVQQEVDRQLAGRMLADVFASQLRKYAMLYGDKAAKKALRQLCATLKEEKS